MTSRPSVRLAAVFALMLGSSVAALQQRPAARWIAAWSTAQQSEGQTAITKATVRMIARVTIGGEAVRVRLEIGRASCRERV